MPIVKALLADAAHCTPQARTIYDPVERDEVDLVR
jgi:hypothetical protein